MADYQSEFGSYTVRSSTKFKKLLCSLTDQFVWIIKISSDLINIVEILKRLLAY